jgi:hypothetical protein
VAGAAVVNPGVKRLYGQVSSKHILFLALGNPQLWVDREGGAMALAGHHSGWGYCWCQPIVVTRTLHGHIHQQVTHRRVADMSDDAYDTLHPEHGWDRDQGGNLYPNGSQM